MSWVLQSFQITGVHLVQIVQEHRTDKTDIKKH
ncbi:uncharacterized protein METZ01_LOCUS265394 [marine metagenome]|uniref:Uncharacterized protein n=1 Tax=marine metagenome TaxID=408172 RepID=A0A382JK82_9ZZZZ